MVDQWQPPQNIKLLAGVDEVGRGPLAGDVVAAAVILPANHSIQGLADSKALSAHQREALYKEITEQATPATTLKKKEINKKSAPSKR